MRVICTRSSIEFTSSGFNSFNINGIHPLFTANFSTLLEVAEDWKEGKLSEGESRVLFLSLLDSTGLVEWKCPATPSDSIVQKYMEYLLVTANWKNAVGSRIPLARVAINHSTCYLHDVRVWINNWNNSQKEFTTSAHRFSLREDISKAQSRVEKLLTAGREGTPTYYKQLAKWFLAATGMSNKATQELWVSLFCMETPELWDTSLQVDFDEMREWAQDNAPLLTGSPNGLAAYRRIEEQYKQCLGGPLWMMTGHLPNYSIFPEEKEDREGGEGEGGEKEETIEERNLAISISLAPSTEPVEKDYRGDRTAFLVARARWRMKMRSLSVSSNSSNNGKDGDSADALQ